LLRWTGRHAIAQGWTAGIVPGSLRGHVAGPLQTPVADAVATGGAVLAGILLPSERSRRRVLDRIEKSLLADDPDLVSLFAVFTRLTRQEAMPGTEQARPRRRPSRERAIAAGVIVVLGALVFCLLAWSPHACGIAPAPGQHHSAVRADSCLARP
jgi:Protein of unknown function (DUF3040)